MNYNCIDCGWYGDYVKACPDCGSEYIYPDEDLEES